MRDTKGEAVAAELEHQAQAGEAAAAVSEALAPDTSAAHEERKADIKAALRALMDCFQGEQVEDTDHLGGGPRKDELSYLRENVLDRVAYRAHRMITIKDKQLDEAGEQLVYLRRRNKGGEVDDAKVLRKLSWLRGIEFEQEAWADLLEAAEDVFYNETGNIWYPRDLDRQAANRATQTAANAEADAALTRLAERKAARQK